MFPSISNIEDGKFILFGHITDISTPMINFKTSTGSIKLKYPQKLHNSIISNNTEIPVLVSCIKTGDESEILWLKFCEGFDIENFEKCREIMVKNSEMF